jgi:hypothetical protein
MNDAAFHMGFQAFLNRRPFKPFLIELLSGDRIRVSHPEALVPRGPLLYHVGPGYRTRLFVSTDVCQLLDVPKAQDVAL